MPRRHRRLIGGPERKVDDKKIPHTIPALMTIDETFDVGVDTRTGWMIKTTSPPFVSPAGWRS